MVAGIGRVAARSPVDRGNRAAADTTGEAIMTMTTTIRTTLAAALVAVTLAPAVTASAATFAPARAPVEAAAGIVTVASRRGRSAPHRPRRTNPARSAYALPRRRRGNGRTAPATRLAARRQQPGHAACYARVRNTRGGRSTRRVTQTRVSRRMVPQTTRRGVRGGPAAGVMSPPRGHTRPAGTVFRTQPASRRMLMRTSPRRGQSVTAEHQRGRNRGMVRPPLLGAL